MDACFCSSLDEEEEDGFFSSLDEEDDCFCSSLDEEEEDGFFSLDESEDDDEAAFSLASSASSTGARDWTTSSRLEEPVKLWTP